MTNLREVAAFLLGEGELDGVGFGDPHPTERGNYWWRKHLRAALAQPEPEIEPDRNHVEDDGCPTEKAVLQRFWREHQMQEPVAWINFCAATARETIDRYCHSELASTPLYTAPPQREWQGLTDEEIREFEIWLDDEEEKHGWNPPADIVKYIERALKEKNHD